MRAKARIAATGSAEKRPPPTCSGAASSVACSDRRNTLLCTAVRALPQTATARSTASGNRAAQ